MPYYDYVLFTLYILSVVLCIYSFVTANANNGKYIGTLLSAHVTQYDSNYYVVETFAKGLIDRLPSNNTCGIRRLHAYSDYMYASNMADAVVIGTTRQIWESYNDPGRCYDASLHNFWNTVGGLSIIIVGLPFVIIIKTGQVKGAALVEVGAEDVALAVPATLPAPAYHIIV